MPSRLSAIGLMAASFLTPLASADEPDARQVAEKVTTEGAALFDTCDAHAMAATYGERAVLTILEKQAESVVPQTHEGRAKIEQFYAELFKKPETIKSRNVVEHARYIAPGVLAIDGTFDTNTLKPDSIKIPFHQVRQQKGGQWLVVSMEISLLPPN